MWIVATVVTTLLPTITGQVTASDGHSRYGIQIAATQPRQSGHTVAGPTFPDNRKSMVHMVANDEPPLIYFFDHPPSDLDLTALPAESTDVVIAKVRATRPPVTLFGRDEVEIPAMKMPRDKFFIRVKIEEVLRGNAEVGIAHVMYFGQPGRKNAYPLSGDQLGRDYVAVIYRDTSDDKYRLLGVPMSPLQYAKWQEEISSYRRSQLRKYKPNAKSN